jgi:nitrate/nitrite transporter NarK
MWERLGRRNAKRSGPAAPLSGAIGRVGGLFGRQETKKHARTTYRGPVGLGLLGALAVVATVSVVLVLRRRAARRSSPVEEESNEEAIEPNEES